MVLHHKLGLGNPPWKQISLCLQHTASQTPGSPAWIRTAESEPLREKHYCRPTRSLPTLLKIKTLFNLAYWFIMQYAYFPTDDFYSKTIFFFVLYILHLALRLQQTSPGGSSFRDGGLVDVCRPCPLFLPQQTAQKPPSPLSCPGLPRSPGWSWPETEPRAALPHLSTGSVSWDAFLQGFGAFDPGFLSTR